VNLPSFIDTYENLAELCEFLSQYEAVAVDTEFVWMRTYFPQLGIIQLGVSPEHSYIVDTVAITDPSPLKELMENESVVKIFHDAQQDITIINRYIDGTVTSVFDTQCAAGFTGRIRSLSLEKLIVIMAGVQLAKSETRTNWLKRPLDPKQIEYALDDVRYLPKIREQLIAEAEELGNLEYLQEEMEQYNSIAPFDYMEAVERQFKKVAGRVPARFRARAYRLVLWQEESARSRDIPREHVIKKEVISQLAQTEIETLEELRESRILTSKQFDKVGTTVIESLTGTEQPSKTLLKKLRRPQSDSNEMAVLISVYHSFVTSLATDRGIDPTLLFNKSAVSSLVRSFAKNRSFTAATGWRGRFVNRASELFLTGKLHITGTEIPEEE
jgi:ribonuclease D